jgi:hypothetical protein
MDKQIENKIEDDIINSYIDNLIPMWEPDAMDSDPRYNSFGESETGKSDLDAFKFFNSEYEKASADNPKVDSIGFERFMKLFRPERSFNEELRKFNDSPKTASKMWRDVYGSDTNLFKKSAFRGYQKAIGLAAGDSKVDKSLNG